MAGDETTGVTEHVSFCRVCNAMCGITVTVAHGPDGERVERVRGDDAHALSRGYTCPKGRALGALHHDPRRLDHPLVGRGEERRVTEWDDVLDDLAERLRSTVAEHGPESVAMYLASGSAFDTAGRRASERFLHVLGSPQKYTATTIDTPCKPLVAELVGGWSGLTPVWDHERSRLLVLFGCNPIVSHGHSNAIPDPVERLRGHRAAGGEVWVVDPRRTETAARADRHLQLRPGTDWLVLGWLVRRLLDDPDRRTDAARRATGIDDLAAALAPLTDDLVAGRTGLAIVDLTDLLDAVIAAGRVSALTGTGTSMAATANTTEHLLWALHIVTDSYDRPGGMWFNPGYLSRLDTRDWEPSDGRPGPGPASRPELPRRFGEWPCAALVSEIEAGTVRTLIVVGGNPVTAFPDTDRTRAALASLDTLVVIDVLPTETTELATHALPAVDQLERADTTWLLDSYQLAVAAQFSPAVVAPVAERRPVWWMVGQLAERLGLSALPRGLGVDEVSEDDLLRPVLERSIGGHDTVTSSPSGVVASGAVFGWVHDRVLPEGGWRLGVEPLLDQLASCVATTTDPTVGSDDDAVLLLIPHRQLRTMNSQLRDIAAPGARTESVDVRVHPWVAAGLGPDGTAVTVTSAWGSVTGPLRSDDRLHPTAVTVAHGWGTVNVSRLTSAVEDIDPLTGMVQQSGVPVRLTVSATARAADR